jgi:tRNA(Glu) U13 pseudouridine synthase TruD
VAYRNPASKNFGHLDKVDGKLTTSLADYEKNLHTLVARLKKTGATLVWASTTPVPDGEPGRIEREVLSARRLAAEDFRRVGPLKCKGSRRALRFKIGEPSLAAGADQRGEFLELAFVAPPGCYATVAVREITKNDALGPGKQEA